MLLRSIKIILLSLLFLLTAFLPKNVLAEGEFITDARVEYNFSERGIATIIQTITIENAFTNLYATNYSLILENIDIGNVRATQDDKNLDFNQKSEGSKTIININFDDTVVGKGKSRTFKIAYDNPTFAQRTGEVWEISIPRLQNEGVFRSYEIFLSVPNSFGNEAYISPKAISKNSLDGRTTYQFSKSQISKAGITAGFGAFQVFSFTLNYHLENPLNKESIVEIAIPPDTSLQKMYYQSISPKPENVYVDSDGNWLATYLLKARERVDIQANGSVQIFSGVRPFPRPTGESLQKNLLESQYWPINNPAIKELALRLKDPFNIYDYVSKNLTYDYERVKPNVTRSGAVKALQSPKAAICMEYTDLFIALARSARIPAREINGFAYTENPKIQPLSLVADVLHAWPEYWNDKLKVWVPVDPTWASTTGGIDYFNKLDLRHFTFVIHGQDAQKPYPPGSYKLGSNPQKDVFVSFGQLPNERISQPQIEVTRKSSLPFSAIKYNIKIKNPGPTALYKPDFFVSYNYGQVQSYNVEVLLPFASYQVETSIPFSFLARKTPSTFTVSAADKTLTVTTPKNQVIVLNLLTISFLLILIIFFVLIKLKKINLKKFSQILPKLFRKNANQPPRS